MSRLHKFILLVLILAVFTVSAASVSAQEIDVEDMNNEQLIQLLQAIMQKLEEPEEELPTATPTAIPTPTATPTPEQIPDVTQIDDNEQLMLLMQTIIQMLEGDEDGETAETHEATPTVQELIVTLMPETTGESISFEIYVNKKLMMERIPDDRFIQKPNGKPEKPSEPGKKNKDDDSHGWIWDDDVESCPPGLHWECTPERCICVSPNG